MTFDAREASRQLGSPVTLYHFRYGVDAAAYHAFTDAESPVTYDGIEYTPKTISRGNITSSGSLDRTTLEVKVSISNPLGNLFLSYPPSQVVTLTIRQGHLGDSPPDFPATWIGRVINCTREKSEMTLTCEPAATSMRRQGLRRNWQKPCPHVLYAQGDGLCNADMAAATITRTVELIIDNIVRLPVGWDSVHPAAKYIGGMIRWTTDDNLVEYRTILRIISGVRLVTNGAIRGLSPSDSVDVILGCNHSASEISGDCINLHDNIVNYGGQPFRPKKNPMGNTSPFV